MNYRYVSATEDPLGVCNILEITTGQTLLENLPLKEARQMCRHFNFGGGFDGWTPAFFLEKLNYIDPETV
jgi:hypothetical protein